MILSIFLSVFCWGSQSQYDLQADRAVGYLESNFLEPDIHRGAIIASPSRSNPNYFYHWVRDAALVMNAYRMVYEKTQDPKLKNQRLQQILAWVDFETKLQNTPNLSDGLGEPKFHVDGRAYVGEWGRPQNDGPAARAITMILLAETLLNEGQKDLVLEKLYRPELPALSPIKRDLEYTAQRWQEATFDLWEEVKGHHFYTRMLQRGALVLGAKLARRLNDPLAADYYEAQAQNLDVELSWHINPKKNLVEPTLNWVDGWTHKNESLDVAVILGVIHNFTSDNFFSPTDSWILSSARQLELRFRQIYSINRTKDVSLGTAIGRYPEDVYDGNGFTGGNPWFLATHAFAELYCRAGQREKGLHYLNRSLFHKSNEGRMDEQFSRHNGFMLAARDLSWSYASYLTAHFACGGDIGR